MSKSDVIEMIDLLQRATGLGIKISHADGQLNVRIPKGQSHDPVLLEEIRQNKSRLVDYFISHGGGALYSNNAAELIHYSIEKKPLSFSQERIWFIDQVEGSIQYHLPVVLRVRGPLNLLFLKTAFQKLLERHEVLRSVIREEDGIGYQQTMASDSWKLKITNWKSEGPEDHFPEQYIKEQVNIPFKLSEDYMLRAELICLPSDEYILVVVLHHIAADGWSLSIMVKELVEFYQAEGPGKASRMPLLPIQYGDYAIWQRELLNNKSFKEGIDYWKQKLSGVAPMDFPKDFQVAVRSIKGASFQYKLKKDSTDRLNQLANGHGCTMFMALLGVFKILLYKYCRQGDISVGTPIANRTNKESEGLIGFFLNILILRSTLHPGMSFSDLLLQIKDTTIDAFEHQDIPFAKVLTEIADNDSTRNSFIKILFVLQNTPPVPSLRLPGIDFIQEEYSTDSTQYDMVFSFIQNSNGYGLVVTYSTDLYKAETIKNICKHFACILDSVINNETKKLSDIDLLGAEDRDLIMRFNPPPASWPASKTIVSLFEGQADRTPGSVALVCEGKMLTYHQLEERSNQLAHLLQRKGVKKESIVPICMERSLEMIVGILGIIKAGGVYVPIEPSYPPGRINYILNDTNAEVIITDTQSLEKLEGESGAAEIIALDTDWQMIGEEPVKRLNTRIDPGQAAYIIYTSGSTGNPKGVIVEHRNVARLFKTEPSLYDFNENDVWTMFHSFCFDFSVWEMYGALFFGGRLIIVSRETARNTSLFAELLISHGVTILNQTPSAFYLLQENFAERDIAGTTIRYVIFGGEALNPVKVKSWMEQFSNSRLINMYGITETTVHVTYHELSLADTQSSTSLIGIPIPTLSVYVLDDQLRILPAGVTGEMYVGGEGVSRGYLNRPDLTTDRFIKNIFGDGKLYRTGDLGRWLTDGTLEYLGRMDQQVKVRGYRIELGEIEATLLETGMIAQAVVLSQTDNAGSSKLVGYVVEGDRYDKDFIIKHLREKLPEYMVPHQIMSLPQLPLTSNGKIDRNALPKIDPAEFFAEQYTAPRNDLEEQLVKIWQETLQVSKVGIHDNFFGLGGDSIKVIQVASRLKKVLEKEIKLFDIYQSGTIEELAKVIEKKQPVNDQSNDTRDQIIAELYKLKEDVLKELPDADLIEDLFPMSDIQSGMIYASLLNPEQAVYHDQFVYQLTEDLDVALFEHAFSLMVAKHSMLRTAFRTDICSEGLQLVYKQVSVKVIYEDLRSVRDEDAHDHVKRFLSKERSRPFDLGKAPLWRSTILGFPARSVFIFQFHHAILDGWSVASFNTELNNLYLRLKKKDNAEGISLLKSSYKDFIIESLTGKRNEENKLFWLNEMSDYKRLDILTEERSVSKSFSKIYDSNYLSLLKQRAKEDGLSLKGLFFAAYLYSLKILTYENEVTIGIVANSRPVLEDGSKVLGCFLNTVPFRFSFFKQKFTWKSYFKEVENKLLLLKERDRTSLYDIAKVCNESAHDGNPFFDIIFNFINFHIYDELQPGVFSPGIADKPGTITIGGGYEATNTFLDFTATVSGNRFRVDYLLRKSLKSGKSLETIHEYFDRILQCYLDHGDEYLGTENVLAASEKEMMMKFNPSPKDYPKEKTVLDMFHEQVVRAPEAIAVVFGQRTITYAELDAQTNQLAKHLHHLGIGKNTLVPVCIEKSIELVIGIVAILKAGAAYVPIDADYPSERIRYMLEDTAASVLLSSSTVMPVITSMIDVTRVKIIQLDTGWNEVASGYNDWVLPAIQPNDLAYLIYTSGSTGKPKGAKVFHKGITNLALWYVNEFSITASDCNLVISAAGFDLTQKNIYGTLVAGGKLAMPTSDFYQPVKTLKYIREHAVTIINCAPSAFYALISEPENFHYLDKLRLLVLGGEAIQMKLLSAWRKSAGNKCEIVNSYGPTECTDISSFYRLNKNDDYINRQVPIGKPNTNVQLFILDDSLSLVPFGVAGELYVGGEGVGAGYLNDEILTASKFQPNPFGIGLIYRTGDICRWLNDGNLEFIGRKDTQVKIRGFRIELGEIENVLKQSPFVEQCAVLVKENTTGEKNLVAYVVPNNTYDESALQFFLKERLPGYMVPAFFINIDKLPLTANGKLDKKYLQRFEEIRLHSNDDIPVTETEKKLAGLWETVLDKKQVGIKTTFFNLGGNSLSLLRMQTLLNRQFAIQFSIDIFFKHTTIKELAAEIDKNKSPIPGLINKQSDVLIENF